jgi:hypothetical protein
MLIEERARITKESGWTGFRALAIEIFPHVPPCKEIFLQSYSDYECVSEQVKNFTNKYELVSIYSDSKYKILLSTLDPPINMGGSNVNPLNAELNPIRHLLILLGDLTFMGMCIVSIFQYISNKMQSYTVYLYLETALHVSGGTSTHHQERIQLYLQHLVFITPLLLYAAIVEELEPVWVRRNGRPGSCHKSPVASSNERQRQLHHISSAGISTHIAAQDITWHFTRQCRFT